MLTNLVAMRAQPKFVDEPDTIYNGMRPEELRLSAEGQLNSLIDRLMNVPEERPARNYVLSEFRKTLARFPAHDTEDRERMCRYLARIMEIVQVQNSGGLLARWLYGSILGTLVWLRHRSN